jgi:hypothetical protein
LIYDVQMCINGEPERGRIGTIFEWFERKPGSAEFSIGPIVCVGYQGLSECVEGSFDFLTQLSHGELRKGKK